jgi:hypothetical protein
MGVKVRRVAMQSVSEPDGIAWMKFLVRQSLRIDCIAAYFGLPSRAVMRRLMIAATSCYSTDLSH